MDRENSLQCQIHNKDNNKILFVCLNKVQPEGLNRLLCQYCLEDINYQKSIVASIDGLRKTNARIIKQWPPLNEQIIQSQQNFNQPIIKLEEIEEFYNNLKDSICQKIDELKKNDLKMIQDIEETNKNFFNVYYEISGFDKISKIIEDNQQQIQNINQLLDDFVKQKYEQTQENLSAINNAQNYFLKADQNELKKIKENILNKISFISCFQKSQRQCLFELIPSQFQDSYLIKIEKDNDIIKLTPSKLLCGQVHSDKPLANSLNYEFIVGFQKKPSNNICIGFEEKLHLNRRLGQNGGNSFILGQINNSFVSQIVKGRNLQSLCNDQFVDKLIIQVNLQENKFLISDYPENSSINCMDSSQYQFLPNKDYYLTIQYYNQETQIKLLSQKVINEISLL